MSARQDLISHLRQKSAPSFLPPCITHEGAARNCDPAGDSVHSPAGPPFSGVGGDQRTFVEFVEFVRGHFVMRSSFGNPDAGASELQGQFRPGQDKIVTRKFGIVAKALWPDKTAAHVAAIAGKDERTAKRWLAGEFEPPAIVIAAIIVEITKLE